jgi:hypothetical protein
MLSALACDADGDGRPDVAASWQASALLLLGDGAGRFRRREVALSNSVRPVGLLDVTGDGRPDLLASVHNHQNWAQLVVWPGGPRAAGANAGLFDRPPVRTPIDYPCDAAAGDFNGDGRADVVCRVGAWTHAFYGVQLWLGAGDGTFGAPSLLTTALGEVDSNNGLTVGDFNGDGLPDAAAAAGSKPEVTVLMNRTGGARHSAGPARPSDRVADAGLDR